MGWTFPTEPSWLCETKTTDRTAIAPGSYQRADDVTCQLLHGIQLLSSSPSKSHYLVVRQTRVDTNGRGAPRQWDEAGRWRRQPLTAPNSTATAWVAFTLLNWPVSEKCVDGIQQSTSALLTSTAIQIVWSSSRFYTGVRRRHFAHSAPPTLTTMVTASMLPSS